MFARKNYVDDPSPAGLASNIAVASGDDKRASTACVDFADVPGFGEGRVGLLLSSMRDTPVVHFSPGITDANIRLECRRSKGPP
jgi:hypothetical protein